jgi:antitoxin VapB
MALNIKDPEVDRLAAEVAAIAGETKTQAVRVALRERRERLGFHVDEGDRHQRLLRVLTEEIWPQIPEGKLGRPMTKAEREAILGYGEQGV